MTRPAIKQKIPACLVGILFFYGLCLLGSGRLGGGSFCSRSLRIGISLLKREGCKVRSHGSHGSCLFLKGGVSIAGLAVASEGCNDGHYEDEGDKAPGNLFEKVGGLTDTECLVASHEIARETLAFTALKKHRTDKQYACKHDENRNDCEN